MRECSRWPISCYTPEDAICHDGIRRHRRAGGRASKGEGLGNQFLANIRETDGIVNVVRCFEDDNVVHVAGKVDPFPTSRRSSPNWPWRTSRPWRKAQERNQKVVRSGDKDAAKLGELLDAGGGLFESRANRRAR